MIKSSVTHPLDLGVGRPRYCDQKFTIQTPDTPITLSEDQMMATPERTWDQMVTQKRTFLCTLEFAYQYDFVYFLHPTLLV